MSSTQNDNSPNKEKKKKTVIIRFRSHPKLRYQFTLVRKKMLLDEGPALNQAIREFIIRYNDFPRTPGRIIT